MMKFFGILTTITFLALPILAFETLKSKISDSCLENTSNAVIEYLQKEEPTSDVHLIKNEQGRVIGLTDSEEIYPGFDLVSTQSHLANRVTILFQSNSYIVFAEVLLKDAYDTSVCSILRVDSGQDDQD